MLIAITRDVHRSTINCELTHLARTSIDLACARKQHELYRDALRSLRLYQTWMVTP